MRPPNPGRMDEIPTPRGMDGIPPIQRVDGTLQPQGMDEVPQSWGMDVIPKSRGDGWESLIPQRWTRSPNPMQISPACRSASLASQHCQTPRQIRAVTVAPLLGNLFTLDAAALSSMEMFIPNI